MDDRDLDRAERRAMIRAYQAAEAMARYQRMMLTAEANYLEAMAALDTIRQERTPDR